MRLWLACHFGGTQDIRTLSKIGKKYHTYSLRMNTVNTHRTDPVLGNILPCIPVTWQTTSYCPSTAETRLAATHQARWKPHALFMPQEQLLHHYITSHHMTRFTVGTRTSDRQANTLLYLQIQQNNSPPHKYTINPYTHPCFSPPTPSVQPLCI
jgi:hypothetical protein